MHDLVLCILAAPEEIDFVSYQYHKVLFQGAFFGLEIHRALILLACVNHLVGISSPESLYDPIGVARLLRKIVLLAIRVICAFANWR